MAENDLKKRFGSEGFNARLNFIFVRAKGWLSIDGEPRDPGDPEILLTEELNNQTAIKEIMATFDTDENTARELWRRFIETVGKMKAKTASNQNQTK